MKDYTLCIPRVSRDISLGSIRQYLEKAKFGKVLTMTEYNANDPLYKKIVFRVRVVEYQENSEMIEKCGRCKENNYFKLVYQFPWYWRIYVNQPNKSIKPLKALKAITNATFETIETIETIETTETIKAVMEDITTQIEENDLSKSQPKTQTLLKPPGLDLIESPCVSLIPSTEHHCQYIMLDKLYPYTQTPYLNPNYQIQMQSIGLLRDEVLHKTVV